MQQTIPWILAGIAAVLLAGAGLLSLVARRKPAVQPLPANWGLAARPVFSADERRVYQQLREALPHHIILSKLPLVRFCQPTDPNEVRYWYELLGAIHVTFAICSANGRVLAAVDLEGERSQSRRVQHIRQAVLAACRVRYLRCPIDHLPSVPELQLLVPHSAAAARGPQPAPTAARRRDHLGDTVEARRRERTALWHDSGFFQDSFFGSESRADLVTDFGMLRRGAFDGPPEEVAGLVDEPSSPLRH
ncbi:MAG: DUF2726 domain-containing protein [Burkholderiales bacterium]|nr:DUF2726 domain-containing protein [Burkholderiales bacterium]MDE2396007.1 DUF2726 domain-containing protein [Burkholderiales bacterium]MDE2457331.1 DUF2726 domain-containing protein [Burkholderiales bacterium]